MKWTFETENWDDVRQLKEILFGSLLTDDDNAVADVASVAKSEPSAAEIIELKSSITPRSVPFKMRQLSDEDIDEMIGDPAPVTEDAKKLAKRADFIQVGPNVYPKVKPGEKYPLVSDDPLLRSASQYSRAKGMRNEELIRLYNDGVPGAEIAERLGKTKSAVYLQIATYKKKGYIQ